MLTRSRRGLAAAVLCGSALMLSGCATGFGAETSQPYNSATGTQHRSGSVELLDAMFVDNGDGTATYSGSFLANDAEGDSLQSVSATTMSGKPLTVELSKPITLKANTSYRAGVDQAEIVLRGDDLAGQFANVTFTFGSAKPVTLGVPIVSREDEQSLSSVATPAPTPTKSPKS